MSNWWKARWWVTRDDNGKCVLWHTVHRPKKNSDGEWDCVRTTRTGEMECPLVSPFRPRGLRCGQCIQVEQPTYLKRKSSNAVSVKPKVKKLKIIAPPPRRLEQPGGITATTAAGLKAALEKEMQRSLVYYTALRELLEEQIEKKRIAATAVTDAADRIHNNDMARQSSLT